MEFHGTAPAVPVADCRGHWEPKAFCRKPERLSVKVGVPAIDGYLCSCEYIYQGWPDPRERWRGGQDSISQTIQLTGLGRHRDIRFAERVIEPLAVLVHYSDFDDLEASVFQLPCRFGIQQQKGRPLFKERLQLRFYLKPRIDPAEIDAAFDAVAMHHAVAGGIVDAVIAVLLESTCGIFAAATLTGMLACQGFPRFATLVQLLLGGAT